MSESGFWVADRDSQGRRRIEDYALIGDCETAALVSRTGSIDWLCWPRFDSEPCLCALLGSGENGFWRIAPAAKITETSRRYRGETMILESRFETATGTLLLTDLMPLRGEAADLIRIVECTSGRVPVRSVLDLRFEQGQLRPLLREAHEKDIFALAGPHGVVLRSNQCLISEDGAISSDFDLSEGEKATFVLTHFPSHEAAPEAVDADKALRDTERFWTEWTSGCTYKGKYREAVIRSMLTLKALTYKPTGGMVAAATSSLPESPGGMRNWDYRYCWLRDAAFVLLAFVHSGSIEEAKAWRNWLLRAVAGEPDEIHPLYAVDGDRGIHEIEAPWLSGFNGATPVRFGNAAHKQLQLDVYGEVFDAFLLARRHGFDSHDEVLELQRRMLEQLEEIWKQPDSGFWEVRSEPEHFVHSKAMAWAAFDRGVRELAELVDKEQIERWRKVRDEIRREVMEKGVDAERNCFVRSFGSRELDAATLVLPLIGFIEPDDPIALGTVAAIERELMPGGLVKRYPESVDDGLPGCEGTFIACSYWLVDNYHLQGRSEDAEALFEKLLGLRNDVGLLAEEYSTREKRLLGNFPQALSHVGLVNSALNMSEAKGPAEDRRGCNV